jgi:hypothetical protein
MLYFSESGVTLPNMSEAADAFHRKYKDDDYERKIARLIRHFRSWLPLGVYTPSSKSFCQGTLGTTSSTTSTLCLLSGPRPPGHRDVPDLRPPTIVLRS